MNSMNKFIIVAGVLSLATPALAAEYYVVQNPKTKVCTIVEERPRGGGDLVIGSPFGVRVEAESHMKTVKECTETTSGRGPAIEERREERVR